MEYAQFDFRTKVAHHPDHVRRCLDGARPFPINVELDLTNACNHRCSFCQWADYIQASRATLPAEIVRRTLEELRILGTRSITWTGGGEPTLHRDFHSLIALASEKGIENGLLTNGSLLRPEHDEALLRHMVWIRVSVAGGDAASYRRVQGRDDFDKVMATLGRLVESRQRWQAKTDLGVAMLVTRDNVHTVEAFARRLARMGVDYVQLRQDMFNDANERAWWNDEAVPAIGAASRAAEGTGLRVLGARYMDAQGDIDYPRRCYAHHFVLAITAEGGVAFCKNTRDKPEFQIGSLHERTLIDIWRSSARNLQLEGSVTPVSCATFCKNMDINSAVEDFSRGCGRAAGPGDPAPVHRNFL